MTVSPPNPAQTLGSRIMEALQDLRQFSEDSDKMTRRYLTPEHRAAAEMVMQWMISAGMTAQFDAVGNVVGRYEAATSGAKTLLTGSHIDTVRNAGIYDGNLGVALPIACIAALNDTGKRLPFAIEVIAFGDEEGVRFPRTLTGSLAIAGQFELENLTLKDADGISLAEALRDFGGDPEAISGLARNPDSILGFIETHIEQGPVLEAEDLPVGVVTAINGASRFNVVISGMAGHAGTVPMPLRRDALAGAAEMVTAIEACALASDGAVATVGRLSVTPDAVNVIPGEVRITIDLRAPSDDLRQTTLIEIETQLAEIASRRDLTIQKTLVHQAPSVACDPGLMNQLESAVTANGIRAHRLPSGAGHDAMAMAPLCPIVMMFVRCAGGISHNPAESITTEDADMAARVFLNFVENFQPS